MAGQRNTTFKIKTQASEYKGEPLSPEKRGFNKWWATKVSSSFFTPFTSCKADKVGTLVFNKAGADSLPSAPQKQPWRPQT